MDDDGLIACVVAPGRTLCAGAPNSTGISTRTYQAGETVRVTPTDAEHLRSIGHLLLADGTPLIRGV